MLRRGFSFIELLLALAILIAIMGLAYTAVVQIMRMQLDQEAITSAQTRMRRVVEIMTQDLRSMLYGGLANNPYVSSTSAISFAVLDGGAGYQVLPSGSPSNFQTASSLSVVSFAPDAARAGIEPGNRVLMINGTGRGVFLSVASFNNSSGNLWLLTHSGCTNTITFSPGNTLLYRVQAVGYQYNASNRILSRQVNNEPANPVAFNITRFEIRYVYRDGAGAEAINPSGYNSTGSPAQQFSSGGQTYTLHRIGLVLATTEPSLGRSIERTYTSQVELPNSNSVPLQEVVPCS